MICANSHREGPGAQSKASTLLSSPGDANMKPLLHLKTVVLLLYVALCTHTVLTALASENPEPAALLPHFMGE
jgi:hypothetical protein